MLGINMLNVKEVRVGTTDVRILSGMHPLGIIYQDDVKLQKTIDILTEFNIDPKSIILGTLMFSRSNFMIGAFASEWLQEGIRTPILVINKFNRATVVHELTHIDQITRGDLVMSETTDVIWKGVNYINTPSADDFDRIVEYYMLPWEQEAYRAEHKSRVISKHVPYWVWFSFVHGSNIAIIKSWVAAKWIFKKLRSK